MEQAKLLVTQAIAPVVEENVPVRETVRAPAVKVDPKLIAAARESRDRYLEQVTADTTPGIAGKYDVSRALPTGKGIPKRLAA